MNFPDSDEHAKEEGIKEGNSEENNVAGRSDETDPFGETMAVSGDTDSRLSESSSSNPSNSDPALESAIENGTQVFGSTSGGFTDPQEWIGKKLGKYTIKGVLGMGGMGVVLRGHDDSIERDVAIKVLPEDLARDEVAVGRFISEAKSAGKLSHPNTVTIYEIGQQDQTHYLAMEIVEGGSAENQLESAGAYSVRDATKMLIEACHGLSAAHEAGLIHRDIKPANLLLTQSGIVKISDFGLAKTKQAKAKQLTTAGQIIGTPYYMSPEQCESRNVDFQSDIYSLGATYYGLLTGKNPYSDSDSVVQVMYAHCNAEPPDPRMIRSEVPAACAQIIERAMAKKPEDRYQSTNEMRADLEAILAAMSGSDISLPSQSSADPPLRLQQQAANIDYWRNPAVLVPAIILLAIGTYFIIQFATRGTDKGNGETANKNGSSNLKTLPFGEPIKIGVLHSLTGTMANSESPVVDAIQLAVNEINENGGLLGRPVDFVVADGASNSEIFAREASRLIKEENVCTIFGCWTSASRKTVVPVIEELDHLLVYPVQYEGIEESPNVVYLGAAPNQQIIPAVKWAYAFANKRKFFLVGSDYVFPRVAHQIIRDQLKELGAELVGDEFVPLGSNNVSAIVNKIKAAQPDVILNSINGDTNKAFFGELRKAGITPEKTPTISFSIGEAELSQMNLDEMTGDFAAWNYFQSVESDENRSFVEGFRKKFGEDRLITDPMESAYFGVKLWAQAVQAAQSIETAEIRRAMRNQRIRSPGGDVRIDPATQHTFKTPRIGRVQPDGQFEIVWTAAKPEAPRPYPDSRTTEEWKALLHDLYSGWGNRWAAPAQD